MANKRKILELLVVSYLLLCTSILPPFLSPAQSQEINTQPIGTISFLEGISDIARNNQEAALVSEHAPVYLNDRIRTKNYSKAEITLVDKSVLKLAANTCISIDEFKLAENKKREFARIKLTRGKMETIVSKTGAPNTFSIDTPNSEGLVKGSDIFVSYLGGRTGVFVQEGAIAVVNPTLPAIKEQVLKGNCVFVPFNEAPGVIRPAMDLEMAGHKKDVERSLVKKWIPSKGSTQMNAVIVSLAGTVRIYKKNSSDWIDAKMNETIAEGDKLQTADDSRAEVRLSNGNALLIQANSELAFSTLRYDQASGNFENTFEMSHGKVSGVVEKITKQSTFQLKTPTAVCGVRGTFLEVSVPAPTPQQPAPQTQVFFEGGNGIVSSPSTGQTQEVAAGQNVAVDPAGKISSPAETSAEQKTTMTQSWTTAQTVDSYSTAQAATGLGGKGPQALPPAPTPMKGEGPPPPPPVNPMGKILPNFPEVIKPPPPPPPNVNNLYTTTLFWHADSTSVHIDTSSTNTNINLALKNDATWTGSIIARTIGSVSPSSWTIEFTNINNDDLKFYLDSSLNPGTPNNNIHMSLDSSYNTISGTSPAKTLTLSSSSFAKYDGVDKVDAQISGTWQNQ